MPTPCMYIATHPCLGHLHQLHLVSPANPVHNGNLHQQECHRCQANSEAFLLQEGEQQRQSAQLLCRLVLWVLPSRYAVHGAGLEGSAIGAAELL